MSAVSTDHHGLEGWWWEAFGDGFDVYTAAAGVTDLLGCGWLLTVGRFAGISRMHTESNARSLFMGRADQQSRPSQRIWLW
jgi:hypothetical protein